MNTKITEITNHSDLQKMRPVLCEVYRVKSVFFANCAFSFSQKRRTSFAEKIALTKKTATARKQNGHGLSVSDRGHSQTLTSEEHGNESAVATSP